MSGLSGGEIIVMAVLAATILLALLGATAAGVAGRGPLPGSSSAGDDVHRPAPGPWTHDRVTPLLVVVAATGLTALTAALLAWGDALDVWAYVLMAGGLLLVWVVSVAAIGRAGGAPEAAGVDERRDGDDGDAAGR